MYLETKELEKQIQNSFSLIKNQIDEKYLTGTFTYVVYFEKAYDNSRVGMYVYSDDEGYHIDSIGDRGGIVDSIVSDDISEILFKIHWGFVSLISINYAKENRGHGRDWRRLMFKYRLELLALIGREYYIRGKQCIEDILKENPYDDKLLG